MTWEPTDEAMRAALQVGQGEMNYDALDAAFAVDAPKIAQAERDRIVAWLRAQGDAPGELNFRNRAIICAEAIEESLPPREEAS